MVALHITANQVSVTVLLTIIATHEVQVHDVEYLLVLNKLGETFLDRELVLDSKKQWHLFLNAFRDSGKK